MKRFMKYISSLLLVSALVISMALPAMADGTVTYDGDAREFIFEPGSEESPTDLFDSFKGVMPGDSITQQVVIRNDASKEVKIKVYMRALGAHEDSVEFLSRLRLTVDQEGDSILFAAPADQTAQLTDWVCLGTFHSGAEIPLNVRLEVPVDLDNEFQQAIGYLDWQFKVEELPVEPDDPHVDTGDTTNITLYCVAAAVCVLALAVCIVLLKKKKKDEAR